MLANSKASTVKVEQNRHPLVFPDLFQATGKAIFHLSISISLKLLGISFGFLLYEINIQIYIPLSYYLMLARAYIKSEKVNCYDIIQMEI